MHPSVSTLSQTAAAATTMAARKWMRTLRSSFSPIHIP